MTTESGSTGRLEAFSDGVFAVAITLLALDLSIDGPGHGSLAHQLGHRWPQFAAYVVSFFTIGIMWVNHHALLRGFRTDRDSRALMFLNQVLLLWIVTIPFVTTVAADYLTKGGDDAHVAAALYNSDMAVLGMSFSALFVWSIRTGFQRHPLTGPEARQAVLRFGGGIVGYLAAIGVAFASAPASLAIDAILAIYYVIERTPTAKDGD